MEGGDQSGERDALPEHARPAARRLGRVPLLGPVDDERERGRDGQGGAAAGPQVDRGLAGGVEAVQCARTLSTDESELQLGAVHRYRYGYGVDFPLIRIGSARFNKNG